MKDRLPARRYRHVVGVARMAEKLARRHGASVMGARIAGIIHDVARHWDPDKLLSYAMRRGIPVGDIERAAPVLLHARVGAAIAADEFGIGDADVLGAIVHHTVARPQMSDLQKCVYLADTLEPSRTFPDREALVAATERSLDEGMLACVHASVQYLRERDVPIAPETVELYNQLVKRFGAAS